MAKTLHAPVRFVLDGVDNRTAKDWAMSGTTPRAWALEHGFAGSWKANGSYITCTRNADGTLTRRQYSDGRPSARTGAYAAKEVQRAS